MCVSGTQPCESRRRASTMQLCVAILLLVLGCPEAAPKKVPQHPAAKPITTLGDCAGELDANASSPTPVDFPSMASFAVHAPAAEDEAPPNVLPSPDIEGLPIDPGTDMPAFTMGLALPAGVLKDSGAPRAPWSP